MHSNHRENYRRSVMKATAGNLTSIADFDPQVFKCFGLQHYSGGPFIVATANKRRIERWIVVYLTQVLVRLYLYFIE